MHGHKWYLSKENSKEPCFLHHIQLQLSKNPNNQNASKKRGLKIHRSGKNLTLGWINGLLNEDRGGLFPVDWYIRGGRA